MKNLSEDALVGLVVGLGGLVIMLMVILIGFGTDAYNQYLKTYNTQKDREMFLKSYEIVIECRKSYTVGNSANSICGQVPVFVDAVK